MNQNVQGITACTMSLTMFVTFEQQLTVYTKTIFVVVK